MAAISRKNYKTIEWHFYNYDEIKRQTLQTKEDIIHASNYSADISGIHGTGISDKTGNTVVEIDGVIRKNTDWCEVIEATIEKYKEIPIGMIIKMVYVKKLCSQRICDNLHIDRSTLYNWKLEIITYAALKACEKKLIEI